MTAARLFLANCLIWLLTLASPAGAGHVVVADLHKGIAQSVFAGLQEGAPERLQGQTDDEYFAVYNAWKNDVAGQANLLGAAVGYATSGGQAVNVSNAASIAQSGALNNYLGHTYLAVLADRLAECHADGACTEEELFSIRDEMLARSLANDEALASCLMQACVEEHLAAVAGLDAFREAIGTDQAARQIIGSALQRNAGVDVGLLAVLGVRGGTSGPTFGPQDWALARAALNVANAETILQQCGQYAACMIAVANEIQADEAFVDLLRDLPGVGGVIAANDCAMTGDALTCAAVSVEALGAAGDMLQNGRRVLLRMGDDTVPATVRTTDEGVEVVTDAGDVVRVADAPNRVVPDGWRPVTGVGAQVSTPRGFTTYRTPDGDLVHVSPGGLQYGADPKFGNRVDHVLDHTAPNLNKPVHSVFNVQGDDALNLVDEAWANRSGAGTLQANGNRTWTVDLGRPVGTIGQTSVQIVVRDGTNELITAFPK